MPFAGGATGRSTTTQGGLSRAATPFACGAGTWWRGFDPGSRIISRLARAFRVEPFPLGAGARLFKLALQKPLCFSLKHRFFRG